MKQWIFKMIFSILMSGVILPFWMVMNGLLTTISHIEEKLYEGMYDGAGPFSYIKDIAMPFNNVFLCYGFIVVFIWSYILIDIRQRGKRGGNRLP